MSAMPFLVAKGPLSYSSSFTPRWRKVAAADFDVGHGEAELGEAAVRLSHRLIDHELIAARQIAQAAGTLLHRVQPQLVGIPLARPFQVPGGDGQRRS